jgi:hypothetical protein
MTKTLRLGSNPSRTGDPEQADTEVKMRRALGLPAGGPRAAADRGSAAERGALTTARGGRGRIAELEEQLEAEQRIAAQAKKDLEAVRATHKDLETRLHHITLARDEALAALEAERKARAEAEGKVASLQIAAPPPAAAADATGAGTESAACAAPAPRRRGRPPGRRNNPSPAPATAEDDIEPVQWWVPGWQER